MNLGCNSARYSSTELLPAYRDVRMQVGHKGMRYMQLHAEAVLDLVERAPREVQFRAVSGDFQVLQGKFIVSQPMEARPPLLVRCFNRLGKSSARAVATCKVLSHQSSALSAMSASPWRRNRVLLISGRQACGSTSALSGGVQAGEVMLCTT